MSQQTVIKRAAKSLSNLLNPQISNWVYVYVLSLPKGNFFFYWEKYFPKANTKKKQENIFHSGSFFKRISNLPENIYFQYMKEKTFLLLQKNMFFTVQKESIIGRKEKFKLPLRKCEDFPSYFFYYYFFLLI